jgi:hypothetical protein
MKWVGHVARLGEGRGVYRVLVGRPEGKRSLGRSRRRWEDNIKMDLRETGIDGVNWIRLAQDGGPMAGFCEHGNELSDSIKKAGTSFSTRVWISQWYSAGLQVG